MKKKPEAEDSATVAPAEVAARLRKAVSDSTSEEDLRVNVEIVIRESLPDLPVPSYEPAIKASTFRGHADAVYQALVIEYKKPGLLRSATKREEAVEQLAGYLGAITLGSKKGASAPPLHGIVAEEGSLFYQPQPVNREQEEHLASTVGVVIDGEHFIFVRRQRATWAVEDQPLSEDTTEKLLFWLRAMNRKDLSPKNLINDFGPQADVAVSTVRVLATLVASGKYPKANVVFKEWEQIFGIVYGTAQLQRPKKSPESAALLAAYRLDLGVTFPTLLFAIHTYYGLLMKLLATEVIVAQGGMAESFISSLGRTTLRQQLAELESGEVLQRQNIRNAIEQDFFGWYTDAWTKELGEALWEVTRKLLGYDVGTFHLKPDQARDLLKDLYHGLIPEPVRHALGEYYTPDWLAEHTIELAGYDGDPHKKLLDPSCGSGTFLVLAIHRVRQWLSDRSVEWGTNEKRREAVDLIRQNIVGFDLNPLAVIASRTNYLFALGPLLRYRSSGADFEIPVYLTDSVLLPATAREQSLFAQDTVVFPMTVGNFTIPTSVVERRQVPHLMNLLHEAIAQKHEERAFIRTSITNLGLTDSDSMEVALQSLFRTMKKLDREGKNRIWTKLIGNRHASLLYKDYFDYVVGNPPHVNWETLTSQWREAAEERYREYGLFSLGGFEGRHGGGKKDIAALFVYAVMDHFLKPSGVMSLVVHVSLFKASGAGEGFRRFKLGDKTTFGIDVAHDFSSFQPFMTAPGMKIKTRTLTFRAVKGAKTKYPVSYHVWTKTKKGVLPGDLTWLEAERHLESTAVAAVPLRGTGGELTPWLTVPRNDLNLCRRVIAPVGYKAAYNGRAGVFTGGLNGAYFVRSLEEYPNGSVLVENLYDDGKILCPKVRRAVEKDVLYPVIRGRSMGRWR